MKFQHLPHTHIKNCVNGWEPAVNMSYISQNLFVSPIEFICSKPLNCSAHVGVLGHHPPIIHPSSPIIPIIPHKVIHVPGHDGAHVGHEVLGRVEAHYGDAVERLQAELNEGPGGGACLLVVL